MGEDTDMTVRALQAMAARAERQLKWAVFLTGAVLLLLAVDLLLKRSVGRQMVQASDMVARAESSAHRTDALVAEVKGRGRQRRQAGGAGGDAGADAGGGVAGNAAMAAGKSRGGVAGEGPARGLRGGKEGGAGGDAGRAGGTDG